LKEGDKVEFETGRDRKDHSRTTSGRSEDHQVGAEMGCVKCGSENQKRVKSVILVIKVERQRENGCP